MFNSEILYSVLTFKIESKQTKILMKSIPSFAFYNPDEKTPPSQTVKTFVLFCPTFGNTVAKKK
jgi:hypothetical protein